MEKGRDGARPPGMAGAAESRAAAGPGTVGFWVRFMDVGLMLPVSHARNEEPFCKAIVGIHAEAVRMPP